MLSNIKHFFVYFALALLFYSTAHAYKTDTVIGKNEVSSKVKIEKIVKTQRIKDNILENVPVAGKIVKEEIDDKTNAIIWTLSNGATVVFKKTDSEIDKIAMTALAKGGILNVPKKEIISTKLVGVFGDVYFDKFRQQLELEGFLYFDLEDFAHKFTGEIEQDSIKIFFEILYWDFTDSKIDSKEVKLYMEYSRSMFEEMETVPFHPKSLLDHGDIIYNTDPYLKPLKSSDFSKFNINTSLKLIKKYLNPADYTFVFVGNININVFREYVETYLASIHSGKEKSILPKHRAAYAGNQKIEIYNIGTYSKEYMYFIIRDQYFQNNELVVDVLKEYLKNILNKYVTTKYIESFYVNGKNNIRRMIAGVGDLLFSIVFSCEPDKIDGNIAAIKEDLKKIANSNIDLDSFNKAKNTIKAEYIKKLQDNMWLSERYAIFSVIYEKSFNDIYEQQKMYDAVTPKDLQEVVAKTLEEGITCILEYPGHKNSRS